MGLGIIIFGFMCLHFQFLDMHIYNIQIFPLSISLIILILGFLYEYQRTHRKEYLFFIGLSNAMILISFMENIRFEYLLLQTLLYTLFLVFMKKEIPTYPQQKAVHYWTVLYGIFGILKASTSLGSYFYTYFMQFSSSYHHLFSAIVCLIVIATLIHLFKMRKFLNIESRPQPISVKKPFYIHILIIIISFLMIVLTQYQLIEHAYQYAIQYRIYQISNSQITINYLVDIHVDYPNGAMSGSGFQGDIHLQEGIKPTRIALKINHQIVSKGFIQYYDDQTYEYIEEESTQISNDSFITPTCEIIIDNIGYSAKAEIVKLNPYTYEDDQIKISHCLIDNGKVLLMPRIEIFQKNTIIQNIQILDKNNHILVDKQNENCERQYHDGVTFYHENPYHNILRKGEAPYRIVIQYKDQDHIIKKEYPLIGHETPLP